MEYQIEQPTPFCKKNKCKNLLYLASEEKCLPDSKFDVLCDSLILKQTISAHEQEQIVDDHL